MIKEMYIEADAASYGEEVDLRCFHPVRFSSVSIFINILQIFGFLGGGNE